MTLILHLPLRGDDSSQGTRVSTIVSVTVEPILVTVTDTSEPGSNPPPPVRIGGRNPWAAQQRSRPFSQRRSHEEKP